MNVKNWATLTCLGVVLCYAALNTGSVDGPEWRWSLLAIGLLGCFHFAFRGPHPEPGLDRFTLLTGASFLLLVALQLAPLPPGLVHLLSPARADLFLAAQPILGATGQFVTLSSVPARTADGAMTFVAYALIAITIRDLTLRFQGSPWITCLPVLFLASVEALLGFFQATGAPHSPVAVGTFPDHNHYSGLLELALPFAALFPVGILQRPLARRDPPGRRVIHFCIFLALAVLLFVGIAESQSRIGFTVACATLVIALTLVFSLRDWSVDFAVSAGRLRSLLPSAILALVAALALLILPTEALTAHFSDLAGTSEISPATRLQIWRDTGELLKSYPIFGYGLGGYESGLLRYKTTAPMVRVDYAHNDYLQILAELGICGFLAGTLFVLHVLYGTVKGARYAPSVEGRYLAIACASAIAAMLFHAVADSDLYVPANGMVAAWIIGISGIFLRSSRPAAHATPVAGTRAMQQLTR